MTFLEIFCQGRNVTIFLDVTKIVAIRGSHIQGTVVDHRNFNACLIYLDKDYDGQGAYYVTQPPQVIVNTIESLRNGAAFEPV